MIKLTMLVKRKATLSYEEFDNYWSEHHAQVVSSIRQILGITRYIQSVPLADKKPGETMRNSRKAPNFNFDGMAEIWWKNKEEMINMRDSIESKKAIKILLDDENQFIDHSQSLIWYSTERVII